MESMDVENLYRRYGPMVIRRCSSILGDEESALDAAQDVFYQVWKKRSKLEDRGVSSLLYTMATNTCLNILRSRKRRGGIHSEFDETFHDSEKLVYQNPNTDFEERIHAAHFIESLFARYDEKTQLIAVYHYVDGFTLEETASMVEMSVSGIRKRLKKLQKAGIEMNESET